MAKHKAPTQITIASTSQETFLHQLVDRYWQRAALVAVAITVGILGWVYVGQKKTATADASWDRLRSEVDLGSGFFPQIQTPTATVLAGLADDLRDDKAGPWAKALEVRRLIDDGDREGARRALGELEATWPKHPIVTSRQVFAEGEAPTTVPAHLRQRLEQVETWEAAHPTLFANPPLPDDAPRVRIVTTRGAIVVGLYKEQAPKHVENFLKLCREGFYNGTAFHRVIRGFMVQGGDPNSREGAPETWGEGGPGYTVPAELSDLRHFRHVLAAAKKDGESESSGSQFYVTTGAPHHLDGVHSVFGALIEGGSVLEEIESGAVVGDRPQDPVRIESVEIVQE